MKAKLLSLAVIGFLFVLTHQLSAQGYIVPNGVVYAGLNFGGGYEVDVIYNPINSYYTGFSLTPKSANTFEFDPIVDVGVRVFSVSANNPISLQPILSQTYTELSYPNTYLFADGVPFYLGLYTGNQNFAPPNGIYTDPLFGWAELENIGGIIELLADAMEYQGGGIYAGTQTIIPTPEPGEFALSALGALLLGFRRWWTTHSRPAAKS